MRKTILLAATAIGIGAMPAQASVILTFGQIGANNTITAWCGHFDDAQRN
jgi:hypothetical protein